MKLHIKNFRSIENLDLELAPITVLYGHNGTGKSSALYAPLTLRNVVSNPNQGIPAFFDYRVIKLGTFEDVIFNRNADLDIEFGISLEPEHIDSKSNVGVTYVVTFPRDNPPSFRIEISGSDDINFIIPRYEGNYPLDSDLFGEGFTWNIRIVDGFHDDPSLSDIQRCNRQLAKKALDFAVSELKRVSFVPLGRGFVNPSYTMQQVSPIAMAATELEMTSLIADDRNLKYQISLSMQRILNREFQVHIEIGTRDFALDSIDKQSGVAATLVNDGFGVNQLVYLLAKVLHPDAGIVCIEEPEIHLHPTAIRRLARELSAIVRKYDGKRLLISTHSEQFIVAFLALVAEGKRSPDDIAIYLVTKDGNASEFQRQQVNEEGQVESGLASFMEGELEDMQALFGVGIGNE